jgi:hypothetical protein
MSLFSEYFSKAGLPYVGLYIHAGVDLPSTSNTGFNVLSEPTQVGYMENNEETEWYVPRFYDVLVEAKTCGPAVAGLYAEIMKAGLTEDTEYCTYADCRLVIPHKHQWDSCIRSSYKLDLDIPIKLNVKGYRVINNPDLVPKGVIVTENACEALKAIA